MFVRLASRFHWNLFRDKLKSDTEMKKMDEWEKEDEVGGPRSRRDQKVKMK